MYSENCPRMALPEGVNGYAGEVGDRRARRVCSGCLGASGDRAARQTARRRRAQGGQQAPAPAAAAGGGGRGAAAQAPAGPTPRLANGQPDLSGLWDNPYTANMAGGRVGGVVSTRRRASR